MNSEFSINALYEALDAERKQRGMAWAQVAREMYERFGPNPLRPTSPSAITGMRKRRYGIEGDGALQMMIWLKRSPESFLTARLGESKPEELLPDVGPGRLVRWDPRALHAALDQQRIARGLTWGEVAGEIGGFSAANLLRMADGGRVAFPHVMRIVEWLGQPAVTFTRVSRF